jgi:hypothetical protein
MNNFLEVLILKKIFKNVKEDDSINTYNRPFTFCGLMLM